MNFPEGGVPIWPPLFDVVLSLPARLAGGASSAADAEPAGARGSRVPLAAGAIVLVALLGRRLHGVAAGVAAAAFLAVCPGHILWSQYGHVDQHAAESFCGLARARALPREPRGSRLSPATPSGKPPPASRSRSPC